MKLTLAFPVLLASLALPSAAPGQTTQPSDPPPAVSPASAPPPAPERPVSWKLMLPNLISDQQHIWTFPARLAQGQDWIPTATVLGATAGLIALDPSEASYFRRTSAFHGFNNIFTGKATLSGIIAAPVSLYGVGLARKDSKMQATALLAGEAIADSELVTTVLKDITGRVRPAAIPAEGNFSDTWFDSGGRLWRGRGSFPSGHAVAAFSVATVVSRRYRSHRWLPYAAYGAAAVAGFSRLTLSAHFLSDVFMGSALAYSIGRFTVLRE